MTDLCDFFRALTAVSHLPSSLGSMHTLIGTASTMMPPNTAKGVTKPPTCDQANAGYYQVDKDCSKKVMFTFYRPQRSCGQGYVFTRVCDSVYKGSLPQCMLGYHPPCKGDPPCQGEPPCQEDPPAKENPPCQGEPPCQGDTPPKETPPPRHTVNEQPVRILLECILVSHADTQNEWYRCGILAIHLSIYQWYPKTGENLTA